MICREVSRLEQASSRRCMVRVFETEIYPQIEVQFPQASGNPLTSRCRGRHYDARNRKVGKGLPLNFVLIARISHRRQQLVSAIVQCIRFLRTEGEDENHRIEE